ncbi:MAG: response regulator [Sedimentisphaerales bacterium]|nr:response regulator [Sedimentisphaerales bacterium]
MRFLITEDDFATRRLMQRYLSDYGNCDIAVDGNEAVAAFRLALEEKEPYDLICLDIMMPGMDGRKALQTIRQIEQEHGIGGFDSTKVIMTTACEDSKNIFGSFREGCEAYIIKPVDKNKLIEEIAKLGLITLVR